jgi:hypothetical protein
MDLDLAATLFTEEELESKNLLLPATRPPLTGHWPPWPPTVRERKAVEGGQWREHSRRAIVAGALKREGENR